MGRTLAGQRRSRRLEALASHHGRIADRLERPLMRGDPDPEQLGAIVERGRRHAAVAGRYQAAPRSWWIGVPDPDRVACACGDHECMTHAAATSRGCGN